MPRTFIPVKGVEERTAFIPLDKIDYIDPGPKDGGGYAVARVEDGTRYTLRKGWDDPANHLCIREVT